MATNLSNIAKPKKATEKRKRVGRGMGSGMGKTSTRGHKGQKARSGYSRRAGFEGGQMPLVRRLPKRGFHHEQRHPLAEVNLYSLELAFSDGEEVTAESLLTKGVAKKRSGGVKILGDVGEGQFTKKLTIKVAAITAGAREKVEAAGGSVEIIEAPKAKAAKPPRQKKKK